MSTLKNLVKSPFDNQVVTYESANATSSGTAVEDSSLTLESLEVDGTAVVTSNLFVYGNIQVPSVSDSADDNSVPNCEWVNNAIEHAMSTGAVGGSTTYATQTDLSNLQTTVTSNTTRIAAAEGSITTNTSNIAYNSSQISANSANIATNTTSITALNTLTSSHTSSINTLNTNVAACVTSSALTSTLSPYATQTYVNSAVSALVNSAPTTLDTLSEIATAIQNDATVTSGILTTLAGKASTTDVASTYLTQTSAASTYLTQTTAASTYVTSAYASANYLTSSGGAYTSVNLVGQTSESITTLTGAATTSYALSNTNNNVVWATPYTANMTLALTGTFATNRSYTLCLNIAGKYYFSALQLNGTSRAMVWSGGLSSISIPSTTTHIVQTITLIFTTSATVPTQIISSVTYCV